MKWELATDKQLWTILKTDADCPLALMERVFQEAVDRGMIKRYIVTLMKAKKLTNEAARKRMNMTHEDIVQLGYVGAVQAIKHFTPGKGTFTNFMQLKISQNYFNQFDYVDAEKRQREEVSYDIEEGNVMEYYLADNRVNVEKTVIQKMQWEEKFSLLTTSQRKIFIHVMAGYNYKEVAERMNIPESTAKHRGQTAVEKMAGRKVNLTKLGIVSRRRIQVQGA